MQPQLTNNIIDRKRRSTDADQSVSEIRVYEHYQQLPVTNKTRTKRRKNNSKLKVASEAKDLSNDDFFYKTLAKSVPKLSQEARDAVELIEPQGIRDDDNTDIDRGVELVQPATKDVSQVNKDDNDENKYVKGSSVGSAEHVSNGDSDVDDNAEDVEDEELNEEEEEETDDGAGEGSDEGMKGAYKEDDVEPIDKEPQIKRVKFTKEFGSHAELLKEVEQLVKKNEEQDDNGDTDVYWEVKYEHPKYS